MGDIQPTDDELAAVELANVLREYDEDNPLLEGAEILADVEDSPGVVARVLSVEAVGEIVDVVSDYTDMWAGEATDGGNQLAVLKHDISVIDNTDLERPHYTIAIDNIRGVYSGAE